MARTPFGYTKEEGKYVPNFNDLSLLEQARDWLEEGSVSLREARDYINSKSEATISHEGLKLRLQRGIYTHGGSLLDGLDDG